MKKLFEINEKLTKVIKSGVNDYFSKNGKEHTYPELNTVLETVRPILREYKIHLYQPPHTDAGGIGVKTILFDTESGEYLSASLTIPAANGHQAGGAITYARRYSIVSMLGLEAVDKDYNESKDKSNDIF